MVLKGCDKLAKRLFVDLKEDHKKNITGSVKFPEDGLFVFEAITAINAALKGAE